MNFNSGLSRSLRLMPQAIRRFTSPPPSTESAPHEEHIYRQWHDYYTRWHQHYYGHLYPGYPYQTGQIGSPGMSIPPPYMDTGKDGVNGQSVVSRQAAWLLFLFTVWMVVLSIEFTDVLPGGSNGDKRGANGANSQQQQQQSQQQPRQQTRKEKWEAGAELFARRQKQRAKDREEKEKNEKLEKEQPSGATPVVKNSGDGASTASSSVSAVVQDAKVDAAPKNA